MNSEITEAQPSKDPVVLRRDHIDRLNTMAKRTGYGLWAVSVVTFFTGLWSSLTSSMHFLSGVALVVGSIILAPSIVISYGIRAARREDRVSNQPPPPLDSPK